MKTARTRAAPVSPSFIDFTKKYGAILDAVAARIHHTTHTRCVAYRIDNYKRG